MEALKGVADHLLATWRPDGASEAEVQDMNKLALSILACGYLCNVYTDARRPVFMPLWNFACNQGGPNPDYVYLSAEIDGAGVYELVGRRGTVRFVEITQQGPGMMTSLKNVEQRMKFNAITHDLDDLTIAEDGSFRVILSVERPEGYDGDWWQLNPAVGKLLMRKCACDWNTEIDAQVAINRLDDSGEDMKPAEIARRFSEMGDWIKGMIDFDMELVRYYRRASRNQRAAPVPVDSAGRWTGNETGLLRRHPRDRRRRSADRGVPRADGLPLLADPGRRRPLLDRRLGQSAVEPQ